VTPAPPLPGPENDPLYQRGVATLRDGGYWRASLRANRDYLEPLLSGRARLTEWRLPRVPPFDDPKLARMIEAAHHIAVAALDDPASADRGMASTGLVVVRIVPGFSDYWTELEAGDQLEEMDLGTATLTEYVPPPTE